MYGKVIYSLSLLMYDIFVIDIGDNKSTFHIVFSDIILIWSIQILKIRNLTARIRS